MRINRIPGKFFLAALVCLLAITGIRAHAAVIPAVDKKVELLSIAARLAGFPEYQNNFNKEYVSDIDKHFSPCKTHPAIRTLQEARAKTGVSYDAVMQMAISLSDLPGLTPAVPLNSPGIPRWNPEMAVLFISQLQDFRTASKADEFFKKQERRYTQAEETLPQLFQSFDIDWYSRFYGKNNAENFHIILGLCNQMHSYGLTLSRPGAEDQFYAIMGICGRFDEKGKFIQSSPFSYLNLLIHEFNHPFINPLIRKHEKNLEKEGKAFFEEIKDQMPPAYNQWQIVLCESLVRAGVVRYMIAHQAEEAQIQQEYASQASQGFLWIPDLVQLLDTYEKNRKTYKDMESFLPRYRDFLRNWNQKLSLCPKVVSIDEIRETGIAISPGIKQLTIHFSKPMDPSKGMSLYLSDKGMPHFPPLDINNCRYSADGKSFIAKFKKEGLKPGWEYSFIMKGQRFQSRDGYPLKTKIVSFKTAEK